MGRDAADLRPTASLPDGSTGRVVLTDLSHPQVDTLLDDVGKLVEKMGCRVLVMPVEQMPGQKGLAATYRH